MFVLSAQWHHRLPHFHATEKPSLLQTQRKLSLFSVRVVGRYWNWEVVYCKEDLSAFEHNNPSLCLIPKRC